MTPTKFTTGANDRSRDAPIGQTAGGLPDDSGRPVAVDEADAARMRDKLLGDGAPDPGKDESEAHPS